MCSDKPNLYFKGRHIHQHKFHWTGQFLQYLLPHDPASEKLNGLANKKNTIKIAINSKSIILRINHTLSSFFLCPDVIISYLGVMALKPKSETKAFNNKPLHGRPFKLENDVVLVQKFRIVYWGLQNMAPKLFSIILHFTVLSTLHLIHTNQ